MFTHFWPTLWHYIVDVVPSLALGLFLSGLIHEFVPQTWINRYLNRKGILPILYATLAGMVLPLCCFGSLPVALGFRKKGVSLGPVLAFLVSTPATSVTAVLVTWRLLGLGFTLYLCLTVVLMGLIMGLVGSLLPNPAPEEIIECCPHCAEGNHTTHHHHQKGFKQRLISILSFGFVDTVKEIGMEMVVGLLLAALVSSFTPLGNLIQQYLFGWAGYLFALIFGLIMYICSTASVPLVDAFIQQGLGRGAGLVLLLVGPITSYGALLVIRKEFGNRVLLVYLTVISVVSLLAGYIFSWL